MAKKVNWIMNWPKQDYTGFSETQITDAREIYKAKAKSKIDGKIEQLNAKGAKISKKYTLRWTNLRSQPLHYLICHIKPPAKEEGDGGTGQSTVSPTPPTKP